MQGCGSVTGAAATSAELARLTQNLAQRIGRYLERQGLWERDAENSCLAGDGLEAEPQQQQTRSWSGRIMSAREDFGCLPSSVAFDRRVLVTDPCPSIALERST